MPEGWYTSVAVCEGCGKGGAKGTVTLVKPHDTPTPAAEATAAAVTGTPGTGAGSSDVAPIKGGEQGAKPATGAGSYAASPATGGDDAGEAEAQDYPEGQGQGQGQAGQSSPSATKKVYVTVVPVPVEEAASYTAGYASPAESGKASGTGYVSVPSGAPLATPPPPVMYEGAAGRMSVGLATGLGLVVGIVGVLLL